MKRKGFSGVLLALGASVFVIAAVVTYFLSSKHLLFFSKAQIIADLPKASPGSEVKVEIDPLPPINAAEVMENSEIATILVRNTNNELEIEAQEASSEGKQNRRGKADVIKLAGVEIQTSGTRLQMTSRDKRAIVGFPILFNKLTGQFAVETPSGQKFLRVLPDEAVRVAQSEIGGGITKMELVEVEKTGVGDDLAFRVSGRKTRTALGVLRVETDVETEVGAQSGLIVKTTGPWWLPFVR